MSSGKANDTEGLRIVHVDDLKPESRSMGERYAFDRAELIPGDGTRPCGVRVYWIPPGKANYPYHYHTAHEEVFYIIRGEGTVLTPQGDRPVRAGDIILCPTGAEGAHRITNSAQEPLVYMEFDAVQFPEIVHYPLSEGVGLLYGDRARNEFYRDGRRATYAEIADEG